MQCLFVPCFNCFTFLQDSYCLGLFVQCLGCTTSPILFVMAMEVIFKAAEGSADPANLGGGCYMTPLKAFMDDTTIICSNECVRRLNGMMQDDVQNQEVSQSLSLSVKKCKIEATTFTIAKIQIPTVSQQSVHKRYQKRAKSSSTCYRRPSSHQ